MENFRHLYEFWEHLVAILKECNLNLLKIIMSSSNISICKSIAGEEQIGLWCPKFLKYFSSLKPGYVHVLRVALSEIPCGEVTVKHDGVP